MSLGWPVAVTRGAPAAKSESAPKKTSWLSSIHQLRLTTVNFGNRGPSSEALQSARAAAPAAEADMAFLFRQLRRGWKLRPFKAESKWTQTKSTSRQEGQN